MKDESGALLPPRPTPSVRPEAHFRLTRVERALDWAQSLSPAPIRFATSCCGMSIVRGGDAFETLGAGPPVSSAREADLLLIAGSITRRQVPLIEALYERMLPPRWVIAWGACAISGGAYANYATVHGLSHILPVDLVVPGCPPPVTALRTALEFIRSGRARSTEARSATSSVDGEWPILRGNGVIEAPKPSSVYGQGAQTPGRRAEAPTAAPDVGTGNDDSSGDESRQEGNEHVDRG